MDHLRPLAALQKLVQQFLGYCHCRCTCFSQKAWTKSQLHRISDTLAGTRVRKLGSAVFLCSVLPMNLLFIANLMRGNVPDLILPLGQRLLHPRDSFAVFRVIIDVQKLERVHFEVKELPLPILSALARARKVIPFIVPVDKFVAPIPNAVMCIGVMGRIAMHPIPVIGDLRPTLGGLAAHACARRAALHVVRRYKAGIVQKGRREIHIADKIGANRTCRDLGRVADQERHLKRLLVD